MAVFKILLGLYQCRICVYDVKPRMQNVIFLPNIFPFLAIISLALFLQILKYIICCRAFLPSTNSLTINEINP